MNLLLPPLTVDESVIWAAGPDNAFNTIIPSKLFEKIQNVDVPQSVCLWILDLLLNRPRL